MDKRLVTLHLERADLLKRITLERDSLARQLVPLQQVSSLVDRALGVLCAGLSYLREHPLAVVLAVSVCALRKPGRTWRWTQHGLFVWRSWRILRAWLPQIFSR